jgi:predicted Zn-dependent protease
MRKAADALYLLATFSIRSQQIEKALTYAMNGFVLFPSDIRLVETYAYALLLSGHYQKAEDVLVNSNISTKNIEYLRSRTAILLDMPKEQRAARLRKYLTY